MAASEKMVITATLRGTGRTNITRPAINRKTSHAHISM
jgi:hypothetical protein